MLSKLLPRPRLNLRTAIGFIAAGVVLGLSSLTVVHAEQNAHGKSNKVFACGTGMPCVEGNSTGDSNTYGVFGNAANGDGVHGITAATGANSGVAGIATASAGSAHGATGDQPVASAFTAPRLAITAFSAPRLAATGFTGKSV